MVNSNNFNFNLTQTDPLIALILKNELIRQSATLGLIASENFASRAVLEAQSNVLSNKYAEGFVGNRYYSGCEYADEIEQLAVDRAKTLFKCKFANVQPHSGSQMNQALLLSFLKPGDTIMGMELKCGGHLTHGSSVNLSGIWFNFIPYKVNRSTGLIDVNEVLNLAILYRPKLIFAGTTSYPRTINWRHFREIADAVNAYLVADISHISGLIAAEVLPSPFPYCHIATTTTHKSLRGPRGGLILTNELHLFKKLSFAIFPGLQGGPLAHVIAAKAVAFNEALTVNFKFWARAVVNNAKVLSDRFVQLGIPIVTNGTDNHLVLIDLKPLKLTGKIAEETLSGCYIVTNKNSLPNDNFSTKLATGLRLGTCGITTRGMMKSQMIQIADIIAKILLELSKTKTISANLEATARKFVLKLAFDFPVLYAAAFPSLEINYVNHQFCQNH
ncbi:MAG: serine hydroxymethyltransferase [Candidatus Hodgkinia cicadicola]